MNPRIRLYAQIWSDMAKLRKMQHKAELGDGVARQKFAEVHGGLEVRRIFLNSVERNAKEEGLEG